MKKKLILLFFPLFVFSCTNVELEGVPQKELILSKSSLIIHSCKEESEDYYCFWRKFDGMTDTTVVMNGKGNYRVEPAHEYITYWGGYCGDVKEKTLDVLNITIKSDTIFVKQVKEDIKVNHVKLYLYDEDNGFAVFEATNPAYTDI